MTHIIDTKSNRRLSARLTTGLAISALLVLGAMISPASAADHHRGRDHRGGHRDSGWSGGYYPAPPVVYGAPYGYPPPVVYGPSIGINLPGISVGIR
jgi:hypothetical protein